MTKEFEKYKGIHPGLVLERELKKRKLSKRAFALSLPEHPQTLNAITKGIRNLNTPLALKIENALGLEEGSMIMLQVFYEIKKQKEGQNKLHPDFSIIHKSLFWDTDLGKIDWEKHARYVIQRVFERGTHEQKQELLRFYGAAKIKEITGSSSISAKTIPVMPHLNTR